MYLTFASVKAVQQLWPPVHVSRYAVGPAALPRTLLAYLKKLQMSVLDRKRNENEKINEVNKILGVESQDKLNYSCWSIYPAQPFLLCNGENHVSN